MKARETKSMHALKMARRRKSDLKRRNMGGFIVLLLLALLDSLLVRRS